MRICMLYYILQTVNLLAKPMVLTEIRSHPCFYTPHMMHPKLQIRSLMLESPKSDRTQIESLAKMPVPSYRYRYLCQHC